MLKVHLGSYYFYCITALTYLIGLVGTDAVQGQVIPDETLEAGGSQVRQETIRNMDSDRISGGTRRGNNLFHSFIQFDVNEGRGAYFDNPAGVSNIFGRVTGSDRSEVLGRVGVIQAGTTDQLGNAHLFLLNPNGILFGRNASLDLGGSFTATTANAIEFGTQGKFSASAPKLPQLLTVNPSAFWFDPNPRDIINQAALIISIGQSLSLLGGNVTIVGDRPQAFVSPSSPTDADGGRIKAPGGRIELGGLSQAGSVQLSANGQLRFPEGVNRANVMLRDGASIEVANIGDGNGEVAIHARNLSVINHSTIVAGVIATATATADPEQDRNQAGNILIDVTDLFRLRSSSKVQNFVLRDATGTSGDIWITTGSLFMGEGAELNTSLFGIGSSGNIQVEARDQVRLERSNIFSSVNPSGNGSSGRVRIEADTVDLARQSAIITGTQGTAQRSGNIIIEATAFSLSNRSRANAANSGFGAAGNVVIRATDQVAIDGRSQIFSSHSGSSPNNSGEIRVRTQSLSIAGKSELNSSNNSTGDAGNVELHIGDRVSFDEGSRIFTSASDGVSGNVMIRANSLLITGRTELNPSASNVGNSGNVVINLRDDFVLSGGSSIRTGVGEGATGNGGDVRIDADSFELNGSDIGANALGSGDAGAVSIILRGRFTAQSGRIITDTSNSAGGGITIIANDIRSFGDSRIQTSVDNNQNIGGDILLRASSIALFDNSDVISSAGSAGRIRFDASAFLGENYQPDVPLSDDRVNIQAEGFDNDGEITTPDSSFIQNSLTQLLDNSLPAEITLANSCITRQPSDRQANGRFVVTGTGGLPERPGNAPVSSYSTGDVRSIPEPNNRPWQMGDPIIEPQGAYRLPNGQMALAQGCH
jgi:filamentous hemagglutinin family protein